MKRLIIVALFLLGTPVFSYAQSAADFSQSVLDVQDAGITLTLTPATPTPNSLVMAHLDSSTADLDLSTITWSVNGVSQKSGLGLKVFSFTTGASGLHTLLSAHITSPTGSYTKSVTIIPGDIDILFQGEGFTPPFYAGRGLWARQSWATLVAIPHVATTDASRLIYRWSVDGQVVGSASGSGKDSFVITDNIIGKPKTVTVDVLTDRDTVVATASATFSPQDPELHVYEDNPLIGFRFNREVGSTYALKDKEVTFAAFPFFFSTDKRINVNLVYNWTTSGNAADIGPSVTFRAPNASGSASISATVESLANVLQTAREDFLVQFSND